MFHHKTENTRSSLAEDPCRARVFF